MKTFNQLQKGEAVYEISRDYEYDIIDHTKFIVTSVENGSVFAYDEELGEEEECELAINEEDLNQSSIEFEGDGVKYMFFTSLDDVKLKMQELRKRVDDMISEILGDFE